jgi:uncharacterized protein with HEPN domain
VKDNALYLQHIADACDRIRSYTAEGRSAFMGSALIQDAVARNLQIIGEATKRLPVDLTARESEIPWRLIAGMRNRLVHDYAGIDLVEVWNVVERDLPPLTVAVARLLNSLPR